jgi:hypothetical protein
MLKDSTIIWKFRPGIGSSDEYYFCLPKTLDRNNGDTSDERRKFRLGIRSSDGSLLSPKDRFSDLNKFGDFDRYGLRHMRQLDT